MASDGGAAGSGLNIADPNEFEMNLHTAIGYVITQWQKVERAVCDLFKVISTCDNETIAAAIFFQNRDFIDKLETTDVAAKFYLDKDTFYKRWRPLKNSARSAAGLRNACALETSAYIVVYVCIKIIRVHGQVGGRGVSMRSKRSILRRFAARRGAVSWLGVCFDNGITLRAGLCGGGRVTSAPSRL